MSLDVQDGSSGHATAPWSVVRAIDAVALAHPDHVAVETWGGGGGGGGGGGPCGGAPPGASSTHTFRELHALAVALAHGLAAVEGVADAASAVWPSERPREGMKCAEPAVVPVGVRWCP